MGGCVRNKCQWLNFQKVEAEGEKEKHFGKFGNSFLNSWYNACYVNYWIEIEYLHFFEMDRNSESYF